jgi:hypothetical protein
MGRSLNTFLEHILSDMPPYIAYLLVIIIPIVILVVGEKALSLISDFIKKISRLNSDAIADLIGMITLGPLFFFIIVGSPFFALYVIVSLLTPSERYPYNAFELTDITLVKVVEDKKSERVKKITLNREVDKKRSDGYISKLNELNKDRFEFSDVRKAIFLRDEVKKITSEQIVVNLNCNTGIFKLKYWSYKYGDDDYISASSNTHQLKDLQLNAKNYVEFDKIATQVCSPSKINTPY